MKFTFTPTGSPVYAIMLLFGIAWGVVYWLHLFNRSSSCDFQLWYWACLIPN